MSKSEDQTPIIRYDQLVESALRSVVKKALRLIHDKGLPGNHHFYVTFVTGYKGVNIPEYLVKQYPDEMTIVLQYQFYGLEIEDDHFTVTLSFNNVPERLTIPYDAVTIFADPSVNFALQFQPDETKSESSDRARVAQDYPSDESTDTETEENTAKKSKAKSEEETTGKVISLDTFRKK